MSIEEIANWAQDRVINDSLKQITVDKFIDNNKTDIFLIALALINAC